MKKKFKKMIVSVISILVLCATTGCGANELEETAFPLLVAVDYEEDTKKVSYCATFSRPQSENGKGEELPYQTKTGTNFAQAKKNYENLLQKVPDYNHLKIVLIGEDLVEHKQVYEDMIQTLAETEAFPRNTYVCIIEEVSDVLEIVDKLPESLGNYLENYLENHKEEDNNLISLGDLIDEQENQSLILYAPYFEVEDDIVQMKGQYILQTYD